MHSRSPLRSFLFCALAALLFVPAGRLRAIATTPRIVRAIDENHLVQLKGNVPNPARTATDLGDADGSTQLNHVRLMLSRTPAQEAALDRYMAQLQDKSSPNYHKWLTPERFGALYGPADADIATLTSWLESHGLKVETVSKGRTNIAFSGSATQLEETFHVSIHSFTANGVQFYSNIDDPRIPSALSSVVSGIAHMNTILPRAHSDRGPAGTVNPKSKRLEPVHSDGAERISPLLTADSDFLYIVPGDAATIYDTPNSTFNANYSGKTYDGAGVKIGIGGEALILQSTVAAYRTRFLGNSTQPTIVNVDDVTSSTNSGAKDEAYIDTELSGGLAPGASIYYYTSTDLTSALQKAVDDNTVDIFSLSFGECELDLSTSDNSFFSGLWKQAASQGITVTVSSGDNGSAACDATTNSQGNVTAAVGGLAVNGFASTPYNVAVGGTDFYGLLSDFTTYVSASQGSSSTFYRTALSYIPESTWNDSTDVDGTIANNVPWTAVSGDAAYANIVAGSGGKSSCSTNTTVDTSTAYTVGKCTSGYGKPSWQAGTGVPADGVRDVPDVALMAGNGYDSAAWLICTDDTEKNSGDTEVTENCTKQSDNNYYFAGYGGTSTAAPAFAGILALVMQSTGDRLGQAASNLYTLYNGANSATIFHNTSIGNNSVPCETGTPNCDKNSGGYYYLSGYDTSSQYNLATGMGSVDANLLLTNWTSSVTSTPSFSITGSPITFAAGASSGNTASVSVAPSNGFTGAVALTCALTNPPGGITPPTCSVTSPATITGTTAATATLTVNTTASTTPGAYTFTVTGISASPALTETGTIGVTVTTAVANIGSFSLTAGAASPATVAPGGTSVANITVSTSNGYAGTVVLTCAQTSGPSNASGDVPLCDLTTSGVAVGSSTPISVLTIAEVSTELTWPHLGGKGSRWTGAGGGAILALLFLCGIPARRRKWLAMLSMVLAMAALGSLAACGGGGGGGGQTITNPGTAAGTYVFTITGTGTPTPTTAPNTATFSVVVN